MLFSFVSIRITITTISGINVLYLPLNKYWSVIIVVGKSVLVFTQKGWQKSCYVFRCYMYLKRIFHWVQYIVVFFSEQATLIIVF